MSEVIQGRREKLILGGEELKQLEAATHLQRPALGWGRAGGPLLLCWNSSDSAFFKLSIM